MSKSNRIYKIFMTTMIVAIAGMLLAMGIIAAQKTMKLGVQFSSNPNYRLEVLIEKNGSTAEPVFCNFEDDGLGKQVEMKNGISSLDGNTIVADSSFFTKYENDFTIIIKNYTKTTGISVEMSSTAKIDSGADGIPAQIEAIDNTASKYNDQMGENADSVSFRIYVNSVFPQETTLSIVIEEQNEVSISYELTNINSTNTTTIMEPNTPYTTTLTVNESAVDIDDYSLPEELDIQIGETVYTVSKYETNASGIEYSETYNSASQKLEGTITIPAEKATGNISITASAEIAYWDGTYPQTLKTVGGTGAVENPYLIATAKEFASIASYVDQYYYTLDGISYITSSNAFVHYKIMKNLYFNHNAETLVDDEGNFVHQNPTLLREWEPFWFIGSLDGNGKTFSCLYIDNENVNSQGLFSSYECIRRNGSSVQAPASDEIKNIIFANTYIKGGNYTSCLIGGTHRYSYDTRYMIQYVSNITIQRDVVVIGKDYVGGVCAYMDGGADSSSAFMRFSGCVNYGFVEGSSSVGGICGHMQSGVMDNNNIAHFTNCKNYGKVSGTADVGGIVGYAQVNSSKNYCFVNCDYSSGTPNVQYGYFSHYD